MGSAGKNILYTINTTKFSRKKERKGFVRRIVLAQG
jgi:hypothetical protein